MEKVKVLQQNLLFKLKMYNFSKFFISLLGVGFFPFASGTVCSLLSLIFFYFIINLTNFFYLIIFFSIIFLLSIKLINIYSNESENHDSSEIIIDEFLGINFILIFYEYFKFTNDLIMFILIFILFRFFDIVKLYPANWIDKNIRNSLGVILDDIVAGAYCVIILYCINGFL